MMEGESDSLLCVVCSAHVTDTDNSPDNSSANYLYFSQFCDELEKCGAQSKLNDKPSFNATQFFHNVDSAADYLLMCEECKELVNEAMNLRVNLEKWEMDVLKLQIELLMKLKELEKCNDNYFREMRRIYDKVINSVDNDLEKEGICFGATGLSKNDVYLFREKILDVVPNLALFRDDLKRKLVNPLKSSAPSPSSPSNDLLTMDPGDVETVEDFPPMQINKFKNDPAPDSNEDNINSENSDHNFDLNDFNDDLQASSSDESTSSANLKPKVTKKKRRKIKKSDKLKSSCPQIYDNLPPLPFPMSDDNTSQHKKLLIQIILIPPLDSTSPSVQFPISHQTAYTLTLQNYPWNYNPTSDILTLGALQITVMECQSKKEQSIGLKCSTCDFSTIYKHNNQLRSVPLKVFAMVRKMFEHVVSCHLDGFKCPLTADKCTRKMGSLNKLCKHLNIVHSTKEGPFHCSFCGKGYPNLRDCLYHETTHKDTGERDYVTCEICGTSLLRRSLLQHKRLFCGERAPRSVCQICGKSFSKERTVRNHMLRKHAGEEVKTFVCDVCGRRYAVEIDLKNHKISVHGIYPEGMGRECRKGCGKRFKWQSSLCKHEEKCDGCLN